MKKEKIVPAISGGVDSAVAGLILKKNGYDLIGAFMKNFSETKDKLTNQCLWVKEKEMAEKIATFLKIPFVVFDFEKEYKEEVIKKMLKEYQLGLTPNPDISCNSVVKFPLFWKKSKELGADKIAFGHYAKIIKKKNKFFLFEGKDKQKDQSYFLSSLNEKDLQHTIFPLENMTKKEVRQIAKKNNLPNWNKKSTSGVCFIGNVNMKEFLSKRIKNSPGPVLNTKNQRIGKHQGSSLYTIGERATPNIGIEIKKEKGAEQKRYFIAEKKGNTLIVCPENHPSLFRKFIVLKKIHFINQELVGKMQARIRHLGEKHLGKLEKSGEKFSFSFNESSSSIF